MRGVGRSLKSTDRPLACESGGLLTCMELGITPTRENVPVDHFPVSDTSRATKPPYQLQCGNIYVVNRAQNMAPAAVSTAQQAAGSGMGPGASTCVGGAPLRARPASAHAWLPQACARSLVATPAFGRRLPRRHIARRAGAFAGTSAATGHDADDNATFMERYLRILREQKPGALLCAFAVAFGSMARMGACARLAACACVAGAGHAQRGPRQAA